MFDAVLAGIGQQWLGLERVTGIEPKTYPLNLLFGPMTCPQCATLRVTGV